MLMMGPMPVVVEPYRIQRTEDPEVSRASRYMPFGAVMMNILHGRPGQPETKIHQRVI